jgi:hypothetical protein
MATGDIIETKRPRYQNNERFDEQDAQAEGQLRLTREAAFVKAWLASFGFSVGNGQTIGMVLQGGSLATGVNTVTLGSEVFVAVDADGNLLLKSAATGSITVTVPGGQSTVYAFATDVASDLDVRAFMPATAPFTEFDQSINTRFTSEVGVIAISGNATVNSTVINGVTVPLVAIALVNNAAGTVTILQTFTNVLQSAPGLLMAQTAVPTAVITGAAGAASYTYLVVATTRNGNVTRRAVGMTVVPSAPNTLDSTHYITLSWTAVKDATGYLIYRTAVSGGTPSSTGLIGSILVLGNAAVSFVDNGLAGDSTTPPLDPPDSIQLPISASDRASGVFDVTQMLRALVSMVADIKWKNSRGITQALSNDYGAYLPLQNGLDAVDRAGLSGAVISIGDGVNSYGTYNVNEFANADAMMVQIATDLLTLGTLRSVKRTVLVKPGVYTFSGSTSLPSRVKFLAEYPTQAVESNIPVSPFFDGSQPTFMLSNNTLTTAFQNEFEGITFQTVNGGKLAISSENVFKRCSFANIAPGVVPGYGSPADLSSFIINATSAARYCRFFECDFMAYPSTATASQVGMFSLQNGARELIIRDCTFRTASTTVMVNLFTAAWMACCLIDGCTILAGPGATLSTFAPLFVVSGPAPGGTPNSDTMVRACKFLATDAGGALSTTLTNSLASAFELTDAQSFSFQDCVFDRLAAAVRYSISAVTTSVSSPVGLSIDRCTFNNLTFAGVGLQQTSASSMTLYGVSITNCTFNATMGLSVNYTTTNTLTLDSIVITGNKFLSCMIARIGPTSGGNQFVAINNIRINRNVADGYNAGTSGYALIVFTSYGAGGGVPLTDVEICDNTFTNVIQPYAGVVVGGTQAVAGVLLSVGDPSTGSNYQVSAVRVERNRGRSINNAPTGVGGGNIAASVIAIRTGGAVTAVGNLICRENEVTTIGTGLTNNHVRGDLLYVGSFGGVVRGVDLLGNVVGDRASQLGLLYAQHSFGSLSHFKIEDNDITYFNNRGTAAPMAPIILIDPGSSSYSMVSISGNNFYDFDQSPAGNSTVNVIHLGVNGVVTLTGGVSIQHNQFLIENQVTGNGWNSAGMAVYPAASAQVLTVYNQASKQQFQDNPVGSSGFTFSGSAAVGSTNQV